MSYLRGNTVVDGNLYVEGVLTYSGQRPDINGAITTYKDEGHGVISGRHLLSKNGEDGALQDSVVIERQTTIENEGTDVDFYINLNNNESAPGNESDITFKVFNLNINYPIDRINIEDSGLKAYKSDATQVQYEDFSTKADLIESWGYSAPSSSAMNP